MFYPPEALCRAEPERGPIVFTNVLFCVWKRILDFQFTRGFFLFETLKMFYCAGFSSKLPYIRVFLKKFDGIFFFLKLNSDVNWG